MYSSWLIMWAAPSSCSVLGRPRRWRGHHPTGWMLRRNPPPPSTRDSMIAQEAVARIPTIAPGIGVAGDDVVMAFNVRRGDRDQAFLLPPDVREWLPEGHLAWAVLDAVAQFDLSAFYVRYRQDGRGG